jgi:hypothetical protein
VLLGVTVIEAAVEPLLQEYAVPALAVSVALVPAQTVVALAVIFAAGNVVTLITVAADVV